MKEPIVHLTEKRIHELREMSDLEFNDAMNAIKADPIQRNFQHDAPCADGAKYQYRQ